jgi:poly(A) polymerase
VAFTADWAEDAARRDFTINALYADIHGNVYDYSTGLVDLRAGRVRFIGSADQRIAEDYLRILRLFRIHALYGRDEIDADGLRACADARDHIQSLSGERIQREMLKLLAANEPVAVIRTMAATGVLSQLLPGELLFDRFKAICLTDCDHFFNAEAVLRLGALLSDDVSVRKVATRWRLSNEDRDRLIHMHSNGVKIVSYLSIRDVRRALYKVGVAPFKDLVRLRWAEDAKPSNGVQWRTLLALADGWVKPSLPLSGREVMLAGVPHGPLVGRVLSEVEEWWVDSDFTDDPFSIAERLKAVVQAIV